MSDGAVLAWKTIAMSEMEACGPVPCAVLVAYRPERRLGRSISSFAFFARARAGHVPGVPSRNAP